jgi:hypothetical protein
MAFTQDSIAKQPTVNDIWGTQSNGSTSTNDSNKTIATQGASTTVSPYLQRPSHNPRLENFGNSIANTNNTTNSWNNNNTTSSNSSLPKLLASTTGPKQSSVPDNLEKFPTIVDDTKENVDWSQQIPGIINELLSGVLNNIGDKDKEFNPNAYDLASLWFGDTIANTPNVSRAYTDTINQFLSGVNQRTNSANTLLNDIMQQYSNLGAGAEQNFVNLANLGLAQGSDIEQMISQLGPEFTQLLNQQQGEYSNLKDRSDVIGQVLAGARDKVGGTADTVTQNILDAYQSVLTGQVPEVSKDNINEVFKNNMDLINQSFDDTMTRERRQLVDQMAGRGILTSGVTGRAYGDIVDSALREKQKSMSEIASQRASAMLEMPFRQAQQANALNDHVNTLNTLTNSQATELMDMLQTQYGMSKENAELAINNMVNKYNQESQAMQLQNQLYSVLTGYDTNYQANQLNNTAQQAAFGNQNLQLQQAIAQSAPDAMAKMFDQYGALSQGFLNQLLQREMNALNAEAQIQAAGAANKKSSSSGLLGTILGGMFGGGGGCVRRGTKITMNDGSYKNAEDIKEGDKIRSFDVKTNTYNEAIVDHVEVTTFTNFYEVTPHDGKMIEVSSYHPFLVYTGKKYKFKLIGYWHAIRNVIKHVVTQPKKVIDSIKFGWLSLTRYGILKRHDIIMKDNFENSQIKSILKREGKDVFFNFRLSKYDYPTFIANDIVIEALYEETEKFVKWVVEEGISFDA